MAHSLHTCRKTLLLYSKGEPFCFPVHRHFFALSHQIKFRSSYKSLMLKGIKTPITIVNTIKKTVDNTNTDNSIEAYNGNSIIC